MSSLVYQAVTIKSGQNKSNPINLQSKVIVGLINSTVTGSSISFEAARDDQQTFKTVRKSGSTFSVSLNIAGGYEILQPSDFAGITVLKLVSSSNEAADRTYYLALKDID